MNLLMALILGAEPGPAFDVPIREISLWMHGPELHNLLYVTPGRCALSAPGQPEPTHVTARLGAPAATAAKGQPYEPCPRHDDSTNHGVVLAQRP